jgi:hypothetical protein
MMVQNYLQGRFDAIPTAARNMRQHVADMRVVAKSGHNVGDKFWNGHRHVR